MEKFDMTEEDILAAYDKGELKSINPSGEQIKLIKNAAKATFIKNRRINIRLSSPDLMDIQARSLEEGIPYQTLIASIIHKYVTGRLVENDSIRVSRSATKTGRATR